MPPKAKFTREEIIAAALDIVKTDGFEALTSRVLGTRLGSSARPIFTVFQSMDEVQQAVIESAKALYKEYVDQGLMWEHPFKGVLPLIEESYEEILLSIQNDYGINEPLAEKLYHHLWIYTHGIATLCATKMCRFTGEEISNMITEVCMSILKNMKG